MSCKVLYPQRKFVIKCNLILEDMCSGLTRLKGLATGLGSEIDDQNELLNKITYKAENTDWKVEKQNKELKKILKK